MCTKLTGTDALALSLLGGVLVLSEQLPPSRSGVAVHALSRWQDLLRPSCHSSNSVFTVDHMKGITVVVVFCSVVLKLVLASVI